MAQYRPAHYYPGVLLLMISCLIEKVLCVSVDSVGMFFRVGGTRGLVIGMVFTVVGSCVMAYGSALMKTGLDLEAKPSRFSSLAGALPLSQPTWWVGLSVYSIGASLHIVALGFAPASVLAPMNSVGLIANAIAASKILKEHFGLKEALSTVGTTIGVSLCALACLVENTGKQNGTNMVTMSLNSWNDPWYLSYLAFCFACGFAGMIYVSSEESRALDSQDQQIIELKHMHASNSFNLMTNLGVSQTGSPLSDEGEPHYSPCPQNSGFYDNVDEYQNSHRYSKGIGITYGFLAGLVGSQCVLEVKEIVYCVQYSLEQPEVWRTSLPYQASVLLLISIWLQIYFLNLGLARGEATLVVPTYYVFWTLFGTMGGIAKFQEIDELSRRGTIMFLIGFSLTVLCIAILAIQEVTTLRKFVDDRIPDLPESMTDFTTQDKQDTQLASRVTLAMGLFPVYMLGRAVGRSHFRPLYREYRYARSTASDPPVGNSLNELQSRDLQTLPHSLQLSRIEPQQPLELCY